MCPAGRKEGPRSKPLSSRPRSILGPGLAAPSRESGWWASPCLENEFFGADGRTLQLSFLHVSAETRGNGAGKALFDQARAEARARGAARLYVSATPTERTVRFYLARGCEVLEEPDPRLFGLEPEDIHLACEV
jgi:ribosomal protein S18 acetylase RimI-like enzyme